jgi:hypothetical protein
MINADANESIMVIQPNKNKLISDNTNPPVIISNGDEGGVPRELVKLPN